MPKRKRYILFSYPEYYPSGGSGDIALQSDNIDEIIKKANNIESEWNEVLDLDTGLWAFIEKSTTAKKLKFKEAEID